MIAELLEQFVRAAICKSAQGHVARWEPIFGRRSWWPVHVALWEGPGGDWDMDVRCALDAQVYELAKAEGHNTRQICPRCECVRDESTSFTRWDFCRACAEQVEWEHSAWWLLECERKRERILELERMTPEQREHEHERVRFYLDGLITRSVQ